MIDLKITQLVNELNLKVNEDDYNILSRIITHGEIKNAVEWFDFTDADVQIIKNIIK